MVLCDSTSLTRRRDARRNKVAKSYAENPIASAIKNSAENLIFTIIKNNMQKTVDYCMGMSIVIGSRNTQRSIAMTKTKRVALYLRVSTDGQSVENQRRELLTAAKLHGWEVVEEFSDAGISGAKGRDKRPAFDKMLKAATRRDIDMVAAWSVDRLGRSLQDLLGFLGEIQGAGVDLFLHQQGLDTSTPAGRAMFQMLGVFAEFERSMIVARVHAGLKRARKEGKRLGRPSIDPAVESKIKAALAKGDAGMLKIADKYGVGSGTVQRIKAEMAA
jgi:DNA invertase Pin-like site-specific DNA recombinase